MRVGSNPSVTLSRKLAVRRLGITTGREAIRPEAGGVGTGATVTEGAGGLHDLGTGFGSNLKAI